MCCLPYREMELEPEHYCYSCGGPARYDVTGYDRCPTDRGDEVRETTEWFCAGCLPKGDV